MFLIAVTGSTRKINNFKDNEELVIRIIENSLPTVIIKKITRTGTAFFIPVYKINNWVFRDLLSIGNRNSINSEIKQLLLPFIKSTVKELNLLENTDDKLKLIENNWINQNIDSNYNEILNQYNLTPPTWESLSEELKKYIFLTKGL